MFKSITYNFSLIKCISQQDSPIPHKILACSFSHSIKPASSIRNALLSFPLPMQKNITLWIYALSVPFTDGQSSTESQHSPSLTCAFPELVGTSLLLSRTLSLCCLCWRISWQWRTTHPQGLCDIDIPPCADPRPSCQGGLAFCSCPDFSTSSRGCWGPLSVSPGSRALGLLNRLWRDSRTRVQRTYMIPHAWTDSPSSPTHSVRSRREGV